MPKIDYDAVYGMREASLAPIGHKFPRLSTIKEEKARIELENDTEAYQRKQLQGFTTQELIDCK